jgi:hypothetical protein
MVTCAKRPIPLITPPYCVDMLTIRGMMVNYEERPPEAMPNITFQRTAFRLENGT